ncbi:precorrin-3B C(17)-methyltransferase [Thermomonospora curvata]|uniref:Precorrin-3B C17-methyltransferase n=1 Tax=Thermomonospora curvata (strain ATCC 19995 / DSM 43183 / JCM 3096 / KCTC 9072 / NBRC 15933 / NCIMB 10081 / Henssen B9) TaxID=471852 RepID=D1A9W4_THECD|nr:precorrin-3B C(17)-methyltransferase [Thermomonospora curvata]ACY96900.1 precorrin-3B C17-methyltransferase [Thermomonospora curvata DSM 43183]
MSLARDDHDLPGPIGVVAVTAAGRAAAATLAERWPGKVRLFTDGKAADGLRRAWRDCRAIVAFLAVGATVRILAPLLEHKTTDPAVVCVDESGRHAVAVLGGHHGANALARRLGETLGCRPVITTAGDGDHAVALDGYGADLGFTVENPALLPRVGGAVLSGEPVRLAADQTWPLPPLPPNVHPDADSPLTIRITDRAAPAAPAAPAAENGARRDGPAHPPGDGGRTADTPRAAGELIYRPPSLVVGVGAVRGVSAAEVGALIDRALDEAGLSPASVRCVATIDLKADEEGIIAAARERGWPVRTYPAATLAQVAVPNPAEVVRAEVGTPSVAEAAALHAARRCGRDAELVVPKRKSAAATVAVARLTPKGRLTLVGLGPGARDLLAPRAAAALRRACVVVGLDQYLEQIRDLLRPGTRVLASGLGQEAERARTAVAQARLGHAVALVGSGDAGIYAMAAPALEMAGDDIDVEGVPGITAAIAAAALLGAPLGHDHAYISLSDLHTPWEVIERRVRAAAEGDFTVCFYNPRSRNRDWQLPKALDILAGHRPPTTPVGIVRNAGRPGQTVTVTTLDRVDPAGADMFTVVVVGSSRSRIVAERFVTPRGYRWA